MTIKRKEKVLYGKNQTKHGDSSEDNMVAYYDDGCYDSNILEGRGNGTS